MLKLEIKSTQGFLQDKSKVIKFVSDRLLNNEEFILLIKENDFGVLKNNHFIVNSELYGVSHFLGNSLLPGYDIVLVNKQLDLDNTPYIAIAVLFGDDIVLMKNTGEVFIWLLENGNGEKIFVASNLHEFINLLQF